ncbi:MAG: gamma-glutamyl-gamma-aminobutyrate hydrolase family protein [Deltaproteobacteria bacterium]|nr:gamma-glutamyl-gamma-aminobutyrate hydrolase family protein [Deltaproteobacteria bacterium]MCL5276988.1 gamma-glutamyl-gamma-aminobutyrate hydrolase family protein [Deltaproteobacteria bacterium]
MAGRRKAPLIGITADSGEINKKRAYFAYRSYADAVERYKGIPVLVTYTASVRELADRIDGLVITGGDFDIPPALYGEEPSVQLREMPERTAFESALYIESLKKGIPVLGVCGGCQLINVIAGGSLHQDIERQLSSRNDRLLDHVRGTHRIAIEPHTMLYTILRRKRAVTNTSHHQAIKEAGRGVMVSARADDGVPEAIELKDFPDVLGVQWHPERMGAGMLSIYGWLVGRAAEYGKPG